jgi:hypothetical protein
LTTRAAAFALGNDVAGFAASVELDDAIAITEHTCRATAVDAHAELALLVASLDLFDTILTQVDFHDGVSIARYDHVSVFAAL